MIYDIFRWIGIISGYPFYWLFFSRKLYYENENARKKVKGKALVISNHYCPFDYVLNVFLFFPRKLYVVASEDAFRNKLISFGMKFWGGIQANRITKSMRFVVESVRELKKGHLVQIFPEGHNTDDGTIKSFYPSYIVIALKSKAPIIPVITDGNYGITKRVHIMWGEPIELSQYNISSKPTKDEILMLNDIVHKKVLDLRKELDKRIKIDNARR